jgi:hypothetical protein
MTTVFIIHGTGGHPSGNYFPWLKAELEKLGAKIFVPKFPTPDGQTLENWLKVFSEYKLDENTILVGHSIGAGFVLNVVEQLDRPIRAAFLVSGWTGLLNDAYFDPLIKTFTDRKFNWAKIRQNCKRFYVFHGDNDPYVPLELGKALAKNLRAEIVVIKGGGHLNEKAGYTKFEQLLKLVKKEL